MKPVKSKITKGINIGAKIKTADNSGAKVVQVIGVRGYKGVKARIARAGVGDVIVVSVKQGTQEVRKKVMNAVLIRQRRPFRRSDGTRVVFEDNACVMLKNLEGDPKGTIIKGPVAREVVERFTKIGKICSIVV